MAGGAQQAFAARARITSGVADDPRAHREQMPFGIGAHRVMQNHGMALGVELRRLPARENRLHRAAHQVRCQRRLRLNGEFFFGAEGPAAGGQLNLHIFERQFQRRGDLFLVEDRPLTLRPHLDALSLRQREARFGFQKRRLDRLGREHLVDHMRGGGQGRIHIPARERRGLEQVRMHVQIPGRMHLGRAGLQRRERVRHRFIDFVVDAHFIRRRARMEGGIGDHQDQNISDATSGFAHRDKYRQVGNREAGAALSRNIRRRENPDDARHGQRLLGADRQNLGARVLAQHRSPMQHPRHTHVVDERPVAQRLLNSEVARRGLPDAILFGRRATSPSELLAKIEMAARLLWGQILALVPVDFAPGFAGSLDGVEDARVTGAAAQVAVESLGHGVAVPGPAVPHQR